VLGRLIDSIRPHLCYLNWLCVNDRITFRIATLTYHCLNGSAPSYLSRLIIPLKNSPSIRSSSSALLRVPRTHHVNSGDRSFAKVAPPTSISGTNSLLLFMPPHSPSFVLFYSVIFSTDVCYAFPVTFNHDGTFSRHYPGNTIRTLFG
jgi:hypothetical protein